MLELRKPGKMTGPSLCKVEKTLGGDAQARVNEREIATQCEEIDETILTFQFARMLSIEESLLKLHYSHRASTKKS